MQYFHLKHSILPFILFWALASCQVVNADECTTGDVFCNPATSMLLVEDAAASSCGLHSGAIQNCSPLGLSGQVTTIAGDGSTSLNDAVGTAAGMSNPWGLTTDGTNLYISNLNSVDHVVRSMNIASRQTSFIAGSGKAYLDGVGAGASFQASRQLTTQGGVLYMAGGIIEVIRRIDISTGTVSTVAGLNINAYQDGIGANARFDFPAGVGIRDNQIWVGDQSNSLIRKVLIASETVSTPAGTPGSSGGADGFGNSASFQAPGDVIVVGNFLYISGTARHTIRKMNLTTLEVVTVAGSSTNSGSADGVGSDARFNGPSGITSDGYNLYISDAGNHTIRQMNLETNQVTTIAGQVGMSGTSDGSGTGAQFNAPRGLTTDGFYLYVADFSNHLLRRIE